jgi:hypothetical protein
LYPFKYTLLAVIVAVSKAKGSNCLILLERFGILLREKTSYSLGFDFLSQCKQSMCQPVKLNLEKLPKSESSWQGFFRKA